MDERTAEIEHLISHYLHRDLFRLHARNYLSRTRRGSFSHSVVGSVSFYKDYHSNSVELDFELNKDVVHLTRESLKRAKSTTIRYLHERLHAEPMLDEHNHVHNDGVIFTFVIHEAEF